MLSSRTALAACALVVCAGSAQALPGMSLSFVQATGTAGTADTIDVWLRLTLEGPLTLNSSLGAPFGLDAFDLPTEAYDSSAGGFVPYASLTRVFTNTAFGCGSDFVSTAGDSCGGGAYDFEFHVDNSDPSKPSFNWLESVSLPEGSYDYLFGTFKPVAPVAGKTYTFASAYFTLNFDGYAADGTPLSSSIDLAATCSGDQTGCEFTRTVIGVVPEPASYAMLLAGLAGVCAVSARRRA